jgi:hypothetical protein
MDADRGGRATSHGFFEERPDPVRRAGAFHLVNAPEGPAGPNIEPGPAHEGKSTLSEVNDSILSQHRRCSKRVDTAAAMKDQFALSSSVRR